MGTFLGMAGIVLYALGLVGWIPFFWLKVSGTTVRMVVRIPVYLLLAASAFTVAATAFLLLFRLHRV